MTRSSVVTRVALASFLVAAIGCLRPIDGTLTVSEPLSLTSSSRAVELAPGAYPVEVLARHDDEVTLRIERRPNDVVTAKIRMAAESGQPFDFTYSLSTRTTESPSQVTAMPCTVETPELQCRTTTEADAFGNTEPREVCSTVRVLRRGTRRTSSVRAVDTTHVSGQFIDPASGRELAQLRARSERDRSYSVVSPCG